MDLKPIRTEVDYQSALSEASTCFDHEPEPGTPAGDQFEVLLILLDDYEQKHYPISQTDP